MLIEQGVSNVLHTYSSSFRQGVQAGMSIAIGYFPIAITFGLLAKTTGLSISETLLMSLLVFAGASQYISLSLLSIGTGFVEIILTTFIVNIRHFLMTTALNEKIEEERVLPKMIFSFGITDETFSVAATKEGTVSTGYLFGIITVGYSSWVLNSGLGHLLGASLPKMLQESMSVALYAMFVGLVVPSMKKGTKVVFLALLAACFNSVFTIGNLLESGWAIVAATLLSAVIVETIDTLKRIQRGIDHES
jgi:4-azaleucine resistance transporter AzlC